MKEDNTNNQTYTNRELYLLIERNQDIYLEAHKFLLEKVESILEQTKKTNGSVMNLKLWRSWMTGVGAILIMIVIPLIVYIFNNSIGKVEAKIAEYIVQTK